jgi:hypothetical protein
MSWRSKIDTETPSAETESSGRRRSHESKVASDERKPRVVYELDVASNRRHSMRIKS